MSRARNHAPEVARTIEQISGPKYATTTWMERKRQLLNALKMEKAVTVVTTGLIELVAALNILITLVMMVMEKYRDIAVLMSMGARRAQIRGIFMLQGILIGVVGTAFGLVAGYGLCYFADRYRWIRLDEQVDALSFVPFEPLGGWPVDSRRRDLSKFPGHHLSRAQRHAHRARGSDAVRVTRRTHSCVSCRGPSRHLATPTVCRNRERIIETVLMIKKTDQTDYPILLR